MIQSGWNWYCVCLLVYCSMGESVVYSVTLGATTWPRTIANKADSLGFHRCIHSSAVWGRVGPVVILWCVIVLFYDGCGGEVFCLCLHIVFEVRCLDFLLVLLECFGDWYRSHTTIMAFFHGTLFSQISRKK